MTRNIIVIGGESVEDMTRMTPIDEHIVKSSGKTRPSVLYISTANGDDRIKICDFIAKYETAGCTVTTLAFFIPPFPDAGHISSLFEQADIIYVAGGNTRAMLAVWREFGVTGLLKEACENGKVLCGVSAGAICWFEHGHSDSGGAFALIDGLGLLPGALCPHFSSEAGRKASFVELVQRDGIQPAYAVDDGAALHFKNGKCHRTLHNSSTSHAYEVAAAAPYLQRISRAPDAATNTPT
ncbi:Type 1 glutamine amidotransferase-like domain-containing protein [Pseudomonas poae]|uniref:Peptidase E n=1 Tax=Pseudomonas poae TaxID=200451 RepID=A0A2S9EGP2_9PSED|nr:peptidase E [Pseudomonas poae]PRA30181.1 peptidase E [Pseudomonas poae]PRC14318.1 peptidase E [Pseudomonas poae]